MFTARGHHGNMDWLGDISTTSNVHRHLKDNLTRTMDSRVLGQAHTNPNSANDLVRKVTRHCFETKPFDIMEDRKLESNSKPAQDILERGISLLSSGALKNFTLSCEKLARGELDDDDGEQPDSLELGPDDPPRERLTDLSHLLRAEDSIDVG